MEEDHHNSLPKKIMCAIFGITKVEKASSLAAIGLHGNQHRAIDYAGIASSDGVRMYHKHGAGVTRQVFTPAILDMLPGMHALGHIRYPTVADNKILRNIQPVLGRYNGISFALAHNGNITNVNELKELVPTSSLLTSMDTEYMVRILERAETGDFERDVMNMLTLIKGSFALGILTPTRLIAIRDPSGNRPLSIGKINDGYCISSETCAFSNIGVKFVSDIEPGSMVSIGPNGILTTHFAKKDERKCRFEAIYYSHPSSTVFGEPLTNFRIRLGRALEKYRPVLGGADIVTPIPDSSNFIAMGFGENMRSGTFFPVIIRNHYVGRTFIAATQTKRVAEVAQKFAFTDNEIFGKRIVVIDDSIVRGTTLPVILGILRKLGAKEVHVRIGSPPIVHPCKYGINTPTKEELISASQSPEQIRKALGADSLEFLPLEALKELSPDPRSFCFACMNGEYW